MHVKLELVKYVVLRNGTENYVTCISSLQEMGYEMGIRMIERMCVNRSRFPNQREILKYLCKDVWTTLFSKQADRLQTNGQGNYVIQDHAFLWAKGLTTQTLTSTDLSTSLPKEEGDEGAPWLNPIYHLALACGIIKGALAVLLDIPICNVTADILAADKTACIFHVTLSPVTEESKPLN
eukprot:GHVO01005599.1.p1 GENE.GHVO01005599.1~~GHVO01005599.1.p1  ORF type:complete len:198 (+),score=27.41 GHVO01005599.1:56-595(+)